ncbi:MAG: hypothetical protein ACK56I_25825, partial [bacterium]
MPSGREFLEQRLDERGDMQVDGDHCAAVLRGRVCVATRCLCRPNALFSLFEHALSRFLGEVVDVVLRHDNLDAVHEFGRGARVLRED